MFCKKCGKEIMDEAVVCPGCGCMAQETEAINKGNSSKTSVILGIFGIVLAWLFALAGHIVSIIGIVFGIKEYRKTGDIKGLVLSIIGEVCAIFSSIIGAVMMASIM